ncbi:hypothetical protein D9M71_170330 [compost metagenome]
MRVDSHGQLTECRIEYHIGGFAADAGQGFQLFAGLRHFAGMALDQQAAGFDHVFRFAVVQADGLDVLRQSLDTQGMDRCRGIGDREQFGGGLVDADVGRLRRENHGNQQFER